MGLGWQWHIAGGEVQAYSLSAGVPFALERDFTYIHGTVSECA